MVVVAMAGASAIGSVAGNLVEDVITEDEGLKTGSKSYWISIGFDAVLDASFGALFGLMNGPVPSSLEEISKKGYGKFIANQFKTETISAFAEEILGNITSAIGIFTTNRIFDMINSALDLKGN